jgi:hypothetical protein
VKLRTTLPVGASEGNVKANCCWSLMPTLPSNEWMTVREPLLPDIEIWPLPPFDGPVRTMWPSSPAMKLSVGCPSPLGSLYMSFQ